MTMSVCTRGTAEQPARRTGGKVWTQAVRTRGKEAAMHGHPKHSTPWVGTEAHGLITVLLTAAPFTLEPSSPSQALSSHSVVAHPRHRGLGWS